MPNYIVQGSDLSSVANAIRTKGNTSEQLAFPTDFVSAIEALPSGSGSTLSLIGSGTYTLLSNAGTMVIPVSLSKSIESRIWSFISRVSIAPVLSKIRSA